LTTDQTANELTLIQMKAKIKRGIGICQAASLNKSGKAAMKLALKM